MGLTWTPTDDDIVLEGAVKATSAQHFDLTCGRISVDINKHVGDVPGAVAANQRLYALASGEAKYAGPQQPEARSSRADAETPTYGEEWLVRTAAKDPAADPAYVGLVVGRTAAWATKALAAAAPKPAPTGAISTTNPPPAQNAAGPQGQATNAASQGATSTAQGTAQPSPGATAKPADQAAAPPAQQTSGSTKAGSTSDASGGSSTAAK